MTTRISFGAGIAFIAVAAMMVATAPVSAKKKQVDPEFAPTMSDPLQARPTNGAIFQVANGYAPLTSGNRAASIGDLVTILLVERTQAVKTATQSTDRQGDIGLTPPATGPLSLFNPSDVAMSGGATFAGKGQATQSNTLQGEITVTVAAVYPNGTMLVRGEKRVTLNRGDEYIRISGLVRQIDISADNRIASTRVADARIVYSGKGDIARASKQGWLQSFFSRISPF
ncbi:flagellar basal body L-ring protein FlgH [Sphingobium boeckii]|uniref:Flagellar L-ring protein n=1 Tax=Sphingobium boeckii TaxID=1082345 RepID=A0A7W9AJ91_9SPHN|nr:flagellar basal body L-ring protein FlgH [Sphingobium boeckii]MBB5686472.1 flagellar L-ring protein precursor FlgH [Sphingobium boeckii]